MKHLLLPLVLGTLLFNGAARADEHFPLESAARTVPYGKSVACSTPTAREWDAKFKEMADPSGRAVMDVHQQGY